MGGTGFRRFTIHARLCQFSGERSAQELEEVPITSIVVQVPQVLEIEIYVQDWEESPRCQGYISLPFP